MYCPSRKQELREIFCGRLGTQSEVDQEISLNPSLENSSIHYDEAVVGLVVSYDPQTEGNLRFLLTLRSSELKHHSGQVCLPGGRVDESESQNPLRALDREFFEEVKLPIGSIEWVQEGPWEALFSRHGVKVFPYLGFVSETQAEQIEISSFEVAEHVWLPLSWLFDEHHWRVRTFITDRTTPARSVALPIWVGWQHVTWGLTAGMLALFVRRISGRSPIEPAL